MNRKVMHHFKNRGMMCSHFPLKKSTLTAVQGREGQEWPWGGGFGEGRIALHCISQVRDAVAGQRSEGGEESGSWEIWMISQVVPFFHLPKVLLSNMMHIPISLVQLEKALPTHRRWSRLQSLSMPLASFWPISLWKHRTYVSHCFIQLMSVEYLLWTRHCASHCEVTDLFRNKVMNARLLMKILNGRKI